MQLVLLTALIVGGSTVLGSVIGFFFRDVSHRLNDAILSFAAGVMLAASALGLIVPAWEMVAWPAKIVPLLGVFAGALFLNLMDRLTPHLHHKYKSRKSPGLSSPLHRFSDLWRPSSPWLFSLSRVLFRYIYR